MNTQFHPIYLRFRLCVWCYIISRFTFNNLWICHTDDSIIWFNNIQFSDYPSSSSSWFFDVVKHFTVFWKYLNSCRLKRLVGFSIWFTKMITRKIKSNKRSNFLRNMILTHFYFRVLRTWFLHVVYGRHVIIWCNMKTMRHETYVLFTSICIFLFLHDQ